MSHLGGMKMVKCIIIEIYHSLFKLINHFRYWILIQYSCPAPIDQILSTKIPFFFFLLNIICGFVKRYMILNGKHYVYVNLRSIYLFI